MECKECISASVLDEWREAVFNSQEGYYCLVEEFQKRHPQEYKIITAMYRKRVVLKDCLSAMQEMNEPIYWFTLTFNNKKDINDVKSKRKDAQKFLNKISICYVMVEEYGEDNGRYHIHGFLCFKYGRGFVDFVEWHSRQKIELMEECKLKKKVRYLTKYAVKQVPRIRKSKTMVKLVKFYVKNKRFKKHFPITYAEDYKNFIASVVNPF